MSEFKIPETVEEIRNRIEELYNKINEYNTAYFSCDTLPYTEEEINEIQEEYNFLCDTFKEDKTEKEEVEESEKKFFDKVSPAIWIYTIIVAIASMWFVVSYIGDSFLYGYLETFPSSDAFLAFIENHQNLFLFYCWMLYAIYPLIIIIVSTILKLTIFKSKENKLFSLICLLFIIVELIISYLIIMFQIIA